MTKDDPFPRTIKPKRNRTKHYKIVAIASGAVVTEEGECFTEEAFSLSLSEWTKPLAIVRRGVADYIANLDSVYRANPTWQWRASSAERDVITANGFVHATRISTVVHFFGFRNRAYHLALDPVTFYGKSIDEIWPGDEPVLDKLLLWGKTLSEWCRNAGVSLKPTNGAISAQLLRDPRFYPNDRRKVPASINKRVREFLPGNYYRLFTRDDDAREHTAIYLDQRRAHHYHARTTPLPDSNSLFAFGRFLTLENPVYRNVFPGFCGLYCLLLDPPNISSPFDFLGHPASVQSPVKSFVFSNELPILRDFGYRVRGVIAAWGSKDRDRGIPRYAEWCEEQLNIHSDPAWLKPILLSTYGILAIRPKPNTFVFKNAKRGEPVSIRTGRNHLHGLLVDATHGRKVEPAIANVLHRAMIEAGTRAESLGLAHYLHYKGHNVLSVYADAVMVEANDEIPLPHLPEPWREKERLNHLTFLNTQSFVSGEMTRLPGVTGGELRKVSQGSFKHSPRKRQYEAVTGRAIKTDRRI